MNRLCIVSYSLHLSNLSAGGGGGVKLSRKCPIQNRSALLAAAILLISCGVLLHAYLPVEAAAGADTVLWDATITSMTDDDGLRGWTHSGLGDIDYHATDDNTFDFEGQTYSITGLYDEPSSSRYQLDIDPTIPQTNHDSMYVVMGELRCSLSAARTDSSSHAWIYVDPTSTFSNGADTTVAVLHNENYLTLNGDATVTVQQDGKYEDAGASTPDSATIADNADIVDNFNARCIHDHIYCIQRLRRA